MVERSCSFKIPGAETNDLRIALYERKQVIERLQDELNAEREASATSASVAMSMILRLQREKAELAMEAGHYKRLVEEKMAHAEMSFALLENLIYQKEIKITSLEYQVEAYRSQLLRLGYSDLTSLDVKLHQENDEDNLSIPEEKEVIEESLDSKRHEEKHSLDVYWEQIKKLDEQVKELTDFRDSMQDKTSLSESGLNKREEDFASSPNFQEDTKKIEEAKGLSKTDDSIVIKMLKQIKTEKKSSKRTRDRSGKRNRAEYQTELLRLRQIVEHLEHGRTNTKPETCGVLKQEEIGLLKELSSVQSSEVKSLNTMEYMQPWIDPAIISVQEAMLYFWL